MTREYLQLVRIQDDILPAVCLVSDCRVWPLSWWIAFVRYKQVCESALRGNAQVTVCSCGTDNEDIYACRNVLLRVYTALSKRCQMSV